MSRTLNLGKWSFFACVAPTTTWTGQISISEVLVKRDADGKLVPGEVLTKYWTAKK